MKKESHHWRRTFIYIFVTQCIIIVFLQCITTKKKSRLLHWLRNVRRHICSKSIPYFDTVLEEDENEKEMSSKLQVVISKHFWDHIIGENSRDFPIDIVYTWVDGRDPKWINRYEKEMKKENQKITKSFFENRYEDIEELRYSLRTIEKYAKFVNHIFIITEGHRPSWINDQHPKLTFVNHSSIFPSHYQINGKKISHSNLLPTFNSIAIEFAMVNIPELSEHFIYLNDDVFFGQQVYPSDFFTKEGKPIYYSMEKYTEFLPKKLEESHRYYSRKTYMTSAEIYHSCVSNTRLKIYNKYHRIFPYDLEHISFPLAKTIMRKAKENFEIEVIMTMASKFRTANDMHMQTLLFQQAMIGEPDLQYGYQKNITSSDGLFYIISKSSDVNYLQNHYYTNQLPKFFGINVDKVYYSSRVVCFLNEFMPNLSSFELNQTF
ncbi:hypothetical protein TRFO_02631 [Tritrichomonas foetus]|uniref:Uncharacterized protein n=1 Tax=Tritrichomonas foetus TaxID=1144522 RepID=A0A1J4L342_9EUKA|nr:hypothetical protein TRFO_02631 [Tritrichomonas foetus]|eukprot:OHT16396.1 hypothetical protein TRFO_02631 [Tritrichomonas foetus]